VVFDLPSARQSFLWYHVAAGFQVKKTFLRGVRNGNYATWPKLTTRLIHKYFPDSDETIKGHIKGQRQGIRSTKPHNNDNEAPIPTTSQITKENFIHTHVINLSEEIHSDQTGAFPHTSQRGNRYIMVLTHLDANYIFAEPMKNRTEVEMIKAYQKIVIEASAAFKECIESNGMSFELVPPGNHRRNQAEPAIQTFKAFYFDPSGGRRQIPIIIVVSPFGTGRTHPKSPQTIRSNAQHIGVRARPRTT
jgi:hypothetical protein